MTYEEFNGIYKKIPLWELMSAVHGWTECLEVYVVIGDAWKDTPKNILPRHDFLLTENAFNGYQVGKGHAELERLLKYYADVPCWNLCAKLKNEFMHTERGNYHSHSVYPAIQAHVHFRDIRDGYIREKQDLKKAKRHEYYLSKKEERHDF